VLFDGAQSTSVSDDNKVAHVAFVNSASLDSDLAASRVIVVVNEDTAERLVQLQWKDLVASVTLDPASVSTFVWNEEA
jgi:O-glycosyl hydrolase